jgi:hypothetical protein
VDELDAVDWCISFTGREVDQCVTLFYETVWSCFERHVLARYSGCVWDDPLFGALQFTSGEVESVLQDLDVNKGSSLDGIRPIILKNCASALFCKTTSF